MANFNAAKLRRQRRKSPQPDPAPATTTELASNSHSGQHDIHPTLQWLAPVGSSPMPPTRPVHLLIASLGNPPPYHNTRHSAGHLLLHALASSLNAPPLAKSRDFGGPVTTSNGYTFFQSPSQMNVSGPAVLKAWKTFANHYDRDEELGLVVLHDELELAAGQVKIKKGEASAKGHNGIKSVQQSLQPEGLMAKLGAKFMKIGVGIGRPLSRDRDDVSEYVLGQLGAGERMKIESAARQAEVLLAKEVERMGR